MTELTLIVIPDPDEIDGASLYVDGHIDAHPYRFLLDTGAGRSHVITDPYTAAFPSVDQSGSSGVFGRRSDDLITVPRIEIGPIVAENVTLTRHPADEPHAMNLIGMDVLKAHRCHFLFDQDRVLIDESAEDAAIAWHALKIDSRYHPYVEVRFGDATANAVWDSGASITVVDLAWAQAHPDFFEPAGTSMGTDSTGTQVESPMFTMRGAVIDRLSVKPHRVAGVDLSHVNTGLEIPMDLILGYNTLRQANWLFDFPRQRWAITHLHA